MSTKKTDYRLTTYTDTPFLGTHYSIDQLINSRWCIVKLFYDPEEAEEYMKILIDRSE